MIWRVGDLLARWELEWSWHLQKLKAIHVNKTLLHGVFDLIRVLLLNNESLFTLDTKHDEAWSGQPSIEPTDHGSENELQAEQKCKTET